MTGNHNVMLSEMKWSRNIPQSEHNASLYGILRLHSEWHVKMDIDKSHDVWYNSKTKERTTMKVKCVKIYVDCQKNDPVDIRCGGPEYLGYDFFVEESKAEEIKNFIIDSCKELNVPIKNIYFDSTKVYTKDLSKVWTKEKVYECIENNEAGLNFNSINSL